MKEPKVAGAIALSVGVALGAVQLAHAADADWYVGIGAGRSDSKLDDNRIAAELDAPGFATTSISTSTHRNAYKLFGGYQFNSNFSLEAGYFDLGKFSLFAPSSPSGSVNGSVDVRGFALDAVALLPFTDRFSAFGKLGVTEAQTRDSFYATAGNSIADPAPRAWHVNPKVGAGLQYLVNPHFAIRGEWERYRISDAIRDHGNVDTVMIGLVFPFGSAPPPTVRVEPAAPAAPVVPPAPPVVATPAPVVAARVPRHVAFDADALFAFNKAELRPEGAAALDRFAAELSETRFDQVTVTGHTDRIGPDEYNRRLSQQRADAVRDYLVGHGGVDAAKIHALGEGKNDPVTRPGQCGPGRSRAVIACLQPDRRVEFEVSGTEK